MAVPDLQRNTWPLFRRLTLRVPVLFRVGPANHRVTGPTGCGKSCVANLGKGT